MPRILTRAACNGPIAVLRINLCFQEGNSQKAKDVSLKRPMRGQKGIKK